MNGKSISRALCRLGTGLVSALFAAAALAATDSMPSSDVIMTVPLADTDIVPTEYNGDLRDLPQVMYMAPRYLHMWNDFAEPRPFRPPVAGTNEPEAAVISLAPMPAPSKNFAGIGFSDNLSGSQAGAGWPPDTNGDVGPTVYIQAVNDAFGIFDKATGNRLAAFTEDSLWSVSGLPSSNPCFSNNQGDPVVLHDGLADRWILTNFGFAVDGGGNPVAPFYQCIAVSKSADPASGGWWFYAVQMDTGGSGKPPANTFNDYGKFGVWTDCLYEGANGFNNSTGNYAGAIFAAFSRTAIFAGQALSSTNSSIGFICTGTDVNGCTGPFTMIPSNLLGISAASQPPAGTPEYFVDESNSAFAFDVRKFVQGATVCGAGSTLGASTTVTQASYPYNASDYVPQRNTTNKLDPLEDRLMQKVQYRKVGSAESLWVVHTVGDGSTTTARPQWAQINVTNKTISTAPVQQQIYAPDTTLYRWMGSLAVDGQGDMALGYSTSSSVAFPSIAYSGRLVTDTLNQLPQSETVLEAGGGSQTNTCNSAPCHRWGDYSAMSIDPVDDCTFWYTNEYYDTQTHGTVGNWQTRIGAFKFPGCIGPPAKLAFTVQPNSSYASGGTITVKVSVEDFNGNVVTGDTSAVTVALTGGTSGAILSGTKTVNAVAGVATFSTLSVNKVGTSYVLNATDASLTAAASTAFNITVGAAKTVTFTTQPATNSNVAAGTTIPLVAHVVDGGGNPVPGQSITLSILNNAGSSTLSVTTNPVATNSSGDATFANVSLNKVGTGYTLKATDTTTPAATPATSNAFNIVAGVGKTVTFTTQPATNSNVAAGTTIPLVAHVVDVGGNPVPNENITLGFNNNVGGSTLTVTTNPVATNTSGDATFANVSLNKVGTGYTLQATDPTTPAATPATSNAFNIVAGAAKTVTFTTQPVTNSNVAAGTTIPLVAHVMDGGGNPVPGQNITLSILNNAGSSTLSVTTNPVMTNASGDATFAGVSLNKVGSSYTLKATDATTPAATPATSNAFNIVAGVGKTVTFTTQPVTNSNIAAGATIPLVAHVVDVNGNAVPGQSIALAFGNNASGATLSVTTNPVATNASGDATFANVSLNKAGTGYTLTATDSTAPAATPATSNAFNIVAGVPTQLLFLQQPTNGTAGVALSPAVTVRVLDANNNAVTTDAHSVTLSVVAGSPGGFDPGATVTAAFSNGVATFNNLIFDVAGAGYHLSAADAGDSLTSAPSSAFTIAAGAKRLIFTTEPMNVLRGNKLGTVAVTEDDGSGTVVTTDTSSVHFTITTACGTFDLGSVAMSSGVATLTSSQRFYTLASGLTINATTGVLSGASASFSVISSDLLFADGFDGCRL